MTADWLAMNLLPIDVPLLFHIVLGCSIALALIKVGCWLGKTIALWLISVIERKYE